MSVEQRLTPGKAEKSFIQRLGVDLVKHRYAYSMLIPVIAYYVIFQYGPMYGLLIAFKNFRPNLGVLGSPWAGWYHFIDFFTGVYAGRTIGNTIIINIMNLVFGFPAPIILALLFDELTSVRFKRTVQTISYLPHFISLVVVCGLIKEFTLRDGAINTMILFFNPAHQRANLLSEPSLFRQIFVISGIWQELGWGSIIYLSALSGVDPQLYEAVTIDGGNRWHRVRHVSLPGIQTTIILLLIMRVGGMMNLGYEKIILLYNPATYVTADVISSYVYRRGILEANFSFGAAVGLFNSVINFFLVLIANFTSRALSETSLF